MTRHVKAEASRLSLVAAGAAMDLAERSPDELRRIARAAAEIALRAVGAVRIPDLAPEGEVATTSLRSHLANEVERLDEIYFDLADRPSGSQVAGEQVDAAFARARAAHSALFALARDPFDAAAEAIYEAQAATRDLQGLLRTLGLRVDPNVSVS